MHALALPSAPPHTLTPAPRLDQALQAEWFELVAECAPRAGATALLRAAMPSLAATLLRALHAPPPPDAREATEAVLGLKGALLLLARAAPPAPLGRLLAVRMAQPCGAAASGVEAGGAAAGGTAGSCGAVVVRALLVGLNSWLPSWLLGEAAACLWAMRAQPGFALWLAQALEPDDVPRRGVSADAKATFAQACLEVSSRAHFKAMLKQFTGGKKKGSRGTPQAS